MIKYIKKKKKKKRSRTNFISFIISHGKKVKWFKYLIELTSLKTEVWWYIISSRMMHYIELRETENGRHRQEFEGQVGPTTYRNKVVPRVRTSTL